MVTYILKRILIFIPTLFIVTLFGFIISTHLPANPVDLLFNSSSKNENESTTITNELALKKQWRKKLGTDLPVFYFSLSSFSSPDTLYKITNSKEKECLERLILTYGNWQQIQTYYESINQLQVVLKQQIASAEKDKNYNASEHIQALNQLNLELTELKNTYEENNIKARFAKISSFPFSNQYLLIITSIKNKYETILKTATPWKNYIPIIYFYKQNEYHRWLFGDGVFSKGILFGDFGISYLTRQPVSEIIKAKIKWSMFFALLSVVLCYIISIPLGIRAAEKKNSAFDKKSSFVLFLLYSIPSFWLATLLLMTFANPSVLYWFPASGVKPVGGYPVASTFFDKIKLSFPYIILPLICYTYASIAFFTRIVRVSMIDVLKQDYICTAHAKGLKRNSVIWKHGFKNALLPLITIFANIFPAVIGGSVILETIFTIPGMGYETLIAAQSNNYPMIIAILTITSFLTLLGFLIADILYILVDPRISYK
ncbi:MAG: ABC transporter permease [Bacteroidia bacterium]